MIERTVPGAGDKSAEQLRGLSAKSVGVLRDLGPDVQWVHSYVTEDKVYCIYNAASAELGAEHARRGGFPADRIAMVPATIDPVTTES